MFDRKYSQNELSEQEIAKQKYPCNSMMSLMLKFNAKSSPFEENFFDKSIVKELTTYGWCKSQQDQINNLKSLVKWNNLQQQKLPPRVLKEYFQPLD